MKAKIIQRQNISEQDAIAIELAIDVFLFLQTTLRPENWDGENLDENSGLLVARDFRFPLEIQHTSCCSHSKRKKQNEWKKEKKEGAKVPR